MTASSTDPIAAAVANAARGAELAAPETRAAPEARAHELAEEQAALRRVATLVATGVEPDDLFTAVSDEVARLFASGGAGVGRFEPDEPVLVVVGLSEGLRGIPVGTRVHLDDGLASSEVYRTGHAARRERRELSGDDVRAPGAVPDTLRAMQAYSAVAAPIVVEGSLWGVLMALSADVRLPPDTEERLEKFGELVATAIANAESRSELAASEARARSLVEEQAALRRVATLVARGVDSEELFSAVSDEVARLFASDGAAVVRLEPEGSAVVALGRSENLRAIPVGTRAPLDDSLATAVVQKTGRAARKDLRGSGPDTAATVHAALMGRRFQSSAAAPIVVQGSLWGAMVTLSESASLAADIEQRLEKFTELVATAIANTESRAELAASEARARELAEEQAALRRVATLVAQGASPDELFSAVAEEAAGVIDIPVVGVHRYEADGTFTMLGIAGESGFTAGSRWPVEPDRLAALILATGRPARKDEYSTMPGPLGDAMRENRIVSTIGAPIVVDGTIWGFMVAGARPGKPIPAGAEERLDRFSELVATAIAKNKEQEHRARLADEQAALRRVATLVARRVSPDELFAAVSNEVATLFGAEIATIDRFEPTEPPQITAVGVSAGPNDFLIGNRSPLMEWLAAEEITETGTLADAVRAMGFFSTVSAPILVEGRLWGVLTASSSQESLPLDTEKRIASFSELVATAIANAESRAELAASEARARELAREQAALRRVATLVAKAAKPDEVFASVAQEVADVLGVEIVCVCRHEPDGILLLSSLGVHPFPDGTCWPLDMPGLPHRVYATGRASRIDDFDFTDASGLDASARDAGVKAAVGAPIVVDGSVWGTINIATKENVPFPPNAEERLGRFTDLVATSVSNATMRAELAASRARVMAAADEARRRIERDLHDGAQQRLVTLAIALQRAEAKVLPGQEELRADVSRVAAGLTGALEELREMSRGIHPAVLAEGGLSPALKALGRRSPVRVKLDVRFDHRLPDPVEVAAYYIVSEALTNASKHANASRVWISLRVEERALYLSIRDDGMGGADPSRGSGLIGLKDRVEAVGGTIEIKSPPGSGTQIDVEVPVPNQPPEVPGSA
jgi:signal transduction histidine kinase